MSRKKTNKAVLTSISLLSLTLLLSACGSGVTEQSQEDSVYLVESLEGLQLEKEEFSIENYYIRNEHKNLNYYYIDAENVLWGVGDNSYGQLGNGQQYLPENGYDDSYEMTPQKIAENVVHVDFGGYFAIFLTENGELYGMGANLNGVMGLEVPEQQDYLIQPQEVVAAEPVRLLEDVQYARAGQRGIVALKKDGSVWWWGEVRTTSAKIAENTVGVRYAKPEKMLEDARYVTCGNFCAAAIKKDSTLWTWGNNTFGSCGVDSGNQDFIEKPVKALDDVKMVWMDEARFDSVETRFYGEPSPYRCAYDYVTFVEKEDGSLAACGDGVKGKDSKRESYRLYGDILREPGVKTEDGKIGPVTVVYSDVFQPIQFQEKERNPQLHLKDLPFGMSAEEVTEFLNTLDITYHLVDGISDGENVYNLVQEDNNFTLWFDGQHQLTAISYNAYGTRDGKICMGMTRAEVENVLGEPFHTEDSADNSVYSSALYQSDSMYEIGYFKETVRSIKESKNVK